MSDLPTDDRSPIVPSEPDPINDSPKRTRVSAKLPLELQASAAAVRAHVATGFLAAGRELVRVRPTIRRGQWRDYLEVCGFGRGQAAERRARRLMEATRNVEAGIAAPDMSLRAAIEAGKDDDAEEDQTEDHDPPPYKHPGWREKHRRWLKINGFDVARAWSDDEFRRWWLEGAAVRRMSGEEWARAMMDSYRWAHENAGGTWDAAAHRAGGEWLKETLEQDADLDPLFEAEADA